MSMDFEAWRCKHDDTKFCPEEGCAEAQGCARERRTDTGAPFIDRGPTVDRGPSVGSFRGREIAAWLLTATGQRSIYVGIAVENADGGVPLNQHFYVQRKEQP